jgi:hypothetical protein
LCPCHAFHDRHDFDCPGGTGWIAHGFPHFAGGRFLDFVEAPAQRKF